MISAGRVLLMPKGAYDPSTTYEMLDIVSYNGSSYIAKGTTTGNLPTDTTYWQLSAYGGQAANIAGNFAEIETSSVATSVHYENDIFIDENSQLMKATQTINIGDTIDVNTNCTPTTVEALITSLSDRVDSLDSTNRKLQGAIEIAAQTDLHSLALGEYYKSQTSFYVTNAPVGINQVTSAKFRLTVEAALDNASQASSPLLLTLRTPDEKIFTQGYNGSAWSTWEQSAAKSAVDTLSSKIQTLTNQVKDMNNVLGAKNLLPFNLADIIANNTLGTWSGNNYTISGVTYTVNSDGSITANGIATANTFIDLISATDLSELSDKYGAMVMNGCPSGGGTSSYIIMTYNGTSFFTDNGEGVELPQGTYTNGVRANIRNGYTAENVTFYPMLRLASIEDDTFVPYVKTNRELTAENQTLTNELDTTYLLVEQKTHSFAVSGATNAEILQNLAQHMLDFIQGLNDGVAIELLNLTIRGTGITLIIPQKVLLTNAITDLSFNIFAVAGGSGTTYLYTGTVWASTLNANKLSVCTLQDSQTPVTTNYDFTNATSFNFEMKHWKVVDLS